MALLVGKVDKKLAAPWDLMLPSPSIAVDYVDKQAGVILACSQCAGITTRERETHAVSELSYCLCCCQARQELQQEPLTSASAQGQERQPLSLASTQRQQVTRPGRIPWVSRLDVGAAASTRAGCICTRVWSDMTCYIVCSVNQAADASAAARMALIGHPCACSVS